MAADGRPADVTGLGWELRMLALGVGAALGIVPFACIALAGYLWALVGRDFLTGWLGVRDRIRARPPLRPGPASPPDSRQIRSARSEKPALTCETSAAEPVRTAG